MTPERWTQVKELFHRALELPPVDREAFLSEQCAGDETPDELRAEVHRLLAAHTHADGFIEQSPVADADGTSLLARSIAPMTGRTVGRYAVERLIGAGGMGQVYAARDSELGRPVALKVAFSHDEESRTRLWREAQHASRLNHPHICTIHEVGTFEGQPFIVMELVEGRRLSDAIPPEGLPVADVVRYGQQVADALAHAHHAGVTHGDLKSANVIVTPEARVKVLDFGLSRRSAQDGKDFSKSEISTEDASAAAGTLACMAPELLRGEPADPSSDVWALGVLLHQMAGGRLPFTGATGFELSGAILHEPPAPLPARVPPPLRAVIARCLSKSRGERFADGAEAQHALDAAGVEPARPRRFLWPSLASSRRLLTSRRAGRAAVALLVVALGFGAYRLMSGGATSALGGAARLSTSSAEAARLYLQGMEASRNFRFEDAYKALAQAATIDEGFAEAHLALAFTVDALGRDEEAENHLLNAARYQDRLSDADRLLLQTEQARTEGNVAEAARRLDELIAAHSDVESAYVIGQQLYGPAGPLANSDRMLALGKAGADALPQSTVTRNLHGIALYMAQQYVEAVREFEAYARLAPREPEPHLGLARTYAMMGLPERAVEATERALEIDPASAPAREIRAWTLGMLGRFDAALAPDPGAFLEIMLLSRSGRVREADRRAAEEVRPAGAGGNRRPVTAVHIIHCSETAGRGDYDRAVTICGQIDDSAAPLPAEPRRLSQVMADALGGVSDARRGRLDRASAHLASLTHIHRPGVPLEHWLHKALEGEIALARGELQKAERAFTEGEPPVRTFGFGTGMANNPPFTDGLARIAAAKGDLPGAISRYRNLLTQSAEHKWQALLQPLYVLELARLLERTGNREAARQEYERFLEIWQHADADRPEVGEARAAVARLR